MFYSNFISSIKSRLAVKSILVVAIFISAVSLLFTVFFMTYQKRLLTGELYKRAHALARNLAFNSRSFIITKDKPTIQSLVSGVQVEPDIVNVFLTDHDGTVLTSTDTTHTDETLTFPTRHDSKGRINWYPIDDDTTMRMILPVENKALVIESDTLLYPPKETIPISDGIMSITLINGIQPGFTFSGEEVTFSAVFENNTPGFFLRHIVSASIENRTLRYLVKGSNGFWSHNGRYLAFNVGIPNQLAVLDTVTREKEIIASYGTGRFGVPCFTPDDRYVIVTLLTEIGHERLFRIPRDGGKREQLTFHDGKHWYPNCSPDGKWILYTELEKKTLYVFNTETKKTSRIFPDLKDQHGSGSFSPDGNKICYLRCLNVSTLSRDVFVADFPGNGKPETNATAYGTQLTHTGGYKWFTDWSPDGKWITYAQPQGNANQIWIVQSQGGYPINLTASLLTQRKIIGYAVLDVSMVNLNNAIVEGRLTALIIAFIFTGIGILGAFLLVRNIVRPVQSIAHAAGEIAHGDFDQTLAIQRVDEIGVLAASFNSMMNQLKILIDDKDVRNRELEKAYKKLETLDNAKDDFLSLVSHEIRTPLTSILASSEMLMKGLIQSDETKAKFHTTIVNESKRLTRLVNDVLDLSKIEAGRMTFNRDALNIRELVDEMHKYLDPILSANGIHFDCEHIPSDLRLLGDRDKILQVLENIISNAIKYTPKEGTISVSLKKSNCIGTIAVKDNGKGMPEEDIPRVFDRFTQLENVDHHTKGAGLGMAISKSIIEGLGGKIWIESKPEVGTVVYFTLPRVKSGITTKRHTTTENNDDNQKKNQDMANNDHIKILIVDDEEPLRLTLSECIKSMDLLPIESSSGEEALSLIEHHNPALVILDVMMPDMSGLEVCRKLRKDPKTSTIKIIMLSAKGQLKEQEEGLKAGADRYITKPYDYEEMVKIIEELLSLPRRHRDTERKKSEPGFPD
ncbi:ATP-binding protein [Candidatus Latescibacterota bacterium]